MKSVVILDRGEQRALIRRRQALGLDRRDEVWDGVYVIMPLGDIEHQELTGELTAVFKEALGRGGPRVFPGVNVSDQPLDWKKNYRCPDVVVFLPGNPAQEKGSHYLGGPDFAVEIVSPNDRSRKKFPFYADVGVRELLLVSRKPWRLELYSREGKNWALVGRSDLEQPDELSSSVLLLAFRLVTGKKRPLIKVSRPDGSQSWLV